MKENKLKKLTNITIFEKTELKLQVPNYIYLKFHFPTPNIGGAIKSRPYMY